MLSTIKNIRIKGIFFLIITLGYWIYLDNEYMLKHIDDSASAIESGK